LQEIILLNYKGDIMSGGGGGSKEDRNKQTVTTVRYPAYIESAHQTYLTNVNAQVTELAEESPYADFENVDVDDIFLQNGYTISSFPAMFDMFGKFMAGFDIEIIFDEVYDSVINSRGVEEITSSKSDMLDEDVDDRILPKFSVGMRDIDAVESSSYVIGKSLIEQDKINKVSKFDSEVKYNLLPNIINLYSTRLTWQKDVVNYYGALIQTYYNVKIDTERFNAEKAFNHRFWPYTVMEYERSALGVLTGAVSSSTKIKQDEGGSNILGSALSGAAVGAQSGNMYAAAAGGILGAASSFF